MVIPATSSPLAPAASLRETAGRVKLLRFALGSEQCAVRISSVREILNLPRTTPVPLLPPFVLGVMNLRGAVVPVLDLGDRLGLGAARVSRRSCVVIVERHTPTDEKRSPIGMLVDAVFEVFDAGESDFEPVPRLGTRIDTGFIRDMVRTRDRVLTAINLDAAFDHAALSTLIDTYQEAH